MCVCVSLYASEVIFFNLQTFTHKKITELIPKRFFGSEIKGAPTMKCKR